MKHKKLRFGEGFRVMRADQWLYVVSGIGEALVNGRRRRLAAGSLVFIERREKHEVRNTGAACCARSTSTCLPPIGPTASRSRGDANSRAD